MSELSGTIQSADWKSEKHAPMIDAPAEVRAGEVFTATVHLGAAIAHPNTPQHHIAWMALYYLPEGGRQAIELARAEFSAHGASMTGDPGPAVSQPRFSADVQLAKGGTLQALAYCNLHGLWQSSKPIAVVP